MNRIKLNSMQICNADYVDITVTDKGTINIEGEVFGEGMSDNIYFDADTSPEQTRQLYDALKQYYSTVNNNE